jgi:DNA mismatch endonuclease (patch repair protein)
MADNLTSEQRSYCMSRIRSKNTRPELIVRSLVRQAGYRYKLHKKDLPGNPDIVFVGLRKAIFVHGCFWHMHDCRFGRVYPKSNSAYWSTKRRQIVDRSAMATWELERQGWSSLIVWECELKDADRVKRSIELFLTGQPPAQQSSANAL